MQYDSGKRRLKIVINAPVIIGFSALCLAVMIARVLLGDGVLALFTTHRISLSSPGSFLRAFSYVLGHVSWSHFVGNMSYILLLGPMLEEKYGSRRMILVILMTAFITALINSLLFPGSGLIGASGVVFAFILMTSFTGFREGEIPMSFLLVAAVYLGQQVMDGLFVRDNISQMGHILGGAVGGIIGFAWNRRK